MAKITLVDGNIIEGTIEELKQMGVKFPIDEVEAKWAKIGREPNEFKKGDIVRVDNPCGAAPLKKGDLVEVKYDSSHKGSVLVVDSWAVSVGELVTPVEARFDI